MSNEFLSIKNIARQALPRLIENLVFPNLIYKDYSDAYEVGKGATIQVRKPVVLTASDFNEGSGVSAQDVKEKSVEVTLDKLATVDVEFGAVARATSVDDLNRLFIEPAAAALATKVQNSLLRRSTATVWLCTRTSRISAALLALLLTVWTISPTPPRFWTRTRLPPLCVAACGTPTRWRLSVRSATSSTLRRAAAPRLSVLAPSATSSASTTTWRRA